MITCWSLCWIEAWFPVLSQCLHHSHEYISHSWVWWSLSLGKYCCVFTSHLLNILAKELLCYLCACQKLLCAILSLSLSPAFPSLHLSNHILKLYINRIKQCVKPATGWFTGGFPLCLRVLWLGSRARDTAILFWQGLSLTTGVSSTSHAFCAQLCPAWIARPHVNAAFDLNSWVPENVVASAHQLLRWFRNDHM